MTITRFAGGAAACALLASPAFAQDARPIVVTAGPLPQQTAPEGRPGGATTVDADEFANRTAVSLRDTLADTAGVYAQPRFGQEIRLSIRGSGLSRGFHMRGLTLLQDGVPTNLADDNGDFLELDPQVFEHIEVYRGASALAFGSTTLGGAINAVTPTGRSDPGLTARVDGGTWDTLRGTLAFGAADARGDAWLAITGDTSDGDRAHAGRHAVRVDGNVGLKLAPGLETRFYATANHIVQRLPGALTRAQALATPEVANSAAVAGDQQRNIDSIRLQNRTTLTVGAARISIGGFLNARELFHPIFQVIDQTSTDTGAFASVDWSGRVFSLTAGTMARFGTVDAKQFLNVAGRRASAPTALVEQEARTISSWGELRAQVAPTLALTAGVVHASGKRRVTNILVPANSARRHYDAWSPKFGAIWQPAAGVQAYASYARSAEFPTFGELVQAPLAGFVPLAPQRAWTAEVGTRGRLGSARWDVSVYRADLDGELLQFTVDPNVPASTFNAGRTRHQGVEASLDADLARWLGVGVTWLHSDFAFRGDRQYGDNRLPVIPRDALRARVRLGTPALSVTPAVEWVPQGAWADYRNTTRVPAYALIGATASADIGRVTLFADARNLTGRRAIGDISAVVAATPASAIYYPVERRAVFVGVRAGF